VLLTGTVVSLRPSTARRGIPRGGEARYPEGKEPHTGAMAANVEDIDTAGRGESGGSVVNKYYSFSCRFVSALRPAVLRSSPPPHLLSDRLTSHRCCIPSQAHARGRHKGRRSPPLSCLRRTRCHHSNASIHTRPQNTARTEATSSGGQVTVRDNTRKLATLAAAARRLRSSLISSSNAHLPSAALRVAVLRVVPEGGANTPARTGESWTTCTRRVPRVPFAT